ncbi:MAG: hypothetical protein J6P21_04645 [Clostridia bacterium]|nr:hypothetical protein [Clostridia bacterium]
MSELNNSKKIKIAIALLSVLFSGNSSSDIDYIPNQASGVSMNKNSKPDTNTSQTVGKVERTSVDSNKFFKPLAITTITTLMVSGLVGIAIYGLTRNKKGDDKSEDNIQSKIQNKKNKQEINERINKYQITQEKEIEEHNKNLICNAIELAKKENILRCNENLLKNAMFELFDRLAKLDWGKYGNARLLWRYFHTDKMSNISIGEDKDENYAYLYTDVGNYSIVWLPDNKVVIGHVINTLGCSEKLEETFENLKSPFEVKN